MDYIIDSLKTVVNVGKLTLTKQLREAILVNRLFQSDLWWSILREQNEFDHPVPRDKALEICERMRSRKWRYIWNWIPLAGCWVCCKMNRINLDDPMGCRLVNRNYERRK